MPTEAISRQEQRTLDKKGRNAIKKKFKTLQELKIEYIPIHSIAPNAYNPNRQTEREFELLKLSIKEDGFTQPVVVNAKSKEIVDGEHRWRAMVQLGFTEIPVVFVDMEKTQAYISTLRHNRARGSEDIELSIKILQDLRDMGALDQAVNSLELNEKTLNMLLNDMSAPEQMAGEDFSTAWFPSDADINEEPIKELKDRTVYTSKQAIEKIKSAEQDLKNAKSLTQIGELSKIAARTLETITITFDQKDINWVVEKLGDNPAYKLLYVCCKFLYDQPGTFEATKQWGHGARYESIITQVVEGTYEPAPTT